MTKQEVIEDLRGCIGCGVYEETALMAIEALEKQIPKKPHKINADEYKDKIVNYEFLRGTVSCPNCGIVFRSGIYCDNCGQKLDWSVEE